MRIIQRKEDFFQFFYKKRGSETNVNVSEPLSLLFLSASARLKSNKSSQISMFHLSNWARFVRSLAKRLLTSFSPHGENRQTREPLHHATHAWCAHWHFRLVLFGVADDTLSGEEHAGDGSGVLKSYTANLGWVDNTRLAEVLISVLTSVVAEVALGVANLLHYDRAFQISTI